MQVLIDWLADALEWLLGVPRCIYTQMVKAVTGWLGDVFEPLLTGLIPSGVLSTIPPSVAWGLQTIAFDVGLVIVIGATVLRFAIRRLPFVG